MGSIWVREFSGGLDARRLPETSPGGTLLRARDCHINRGKEIEQRADFVEYGTLPTGQTKGMARTPTGKVVFGHAASVGSLPTDFTYQRLQHPSGEALTRVIHTSLFQGKLHVIGAFADGSQHLFYDGVRISDANAPPTVAGSENPTATMTHVQKAWVTAGPLLFGSAVGDATDHGAGGGVGEVVHDLSTHAEGSEDLVGMARYGEYLAIFAEKVIQVWFLDPDPDLDGGTPQILRNTGSLSARAITEFGDNDIFYLSRSGLRSLRARDSSNSARRNPFSPSSARNNAGSVIASRSPLDTRRSFSRSPLPCRAIASSVCCGIRCTCSSLATLTSQARPSSCSVRMPIQLTSNSYQASP